LKQNLEQYISFISNGRHSYVRVKEGKSLPCGFVRNDGEVLGYELLSAGTKDVFSLVLRLSMVKHFLKEASDSLIMDDPFVDMDPERQQKPEKVSKSLQRKSSNNLYLPSNTCGDSWREKDPVEIEFQL
jgi:uncharacterized protein YhaN